MNTYKNPILSGFYPDPSICRVGEDYYLVTSTFAYFPGVPVFHSRDLVNWVQIGNVLDRPEQLPLEGVEVSRGIFAPTIRYNDGVFYVITTNISGGGNFLVTATNPSGPWSDPYWLKDAPGIDPSLFFENGKCWYHGTRELPNGRYYGDNEIYLQELDLETMKLVGERHTIFHTALQNAVWPEGPHIYKVGEYYYLLLSEGGTAHEHAITVARSKTLTGYYEGCKGNPILTHRHLGKNYPIVNVGHGDLVETPTGDCYMVVLASRPYGGYYRNLGRETFLVPVTWEDGWLVVNYGVGLVRDEEPLPLPVQPVERSGAGVSPYIHLRNPIPEDYIFHDNGDVSLRLAKGKITELGAVSFYARRQQHFSFSAVAELGSSDFDGLAGLVIFQNSKYNYQLLYGKGKVTAMRGEKVLLEKEVTATKLEIRAIEQSLSLYYDDTLLTDNLDGRILSTDVAGGFVGNTIGVYATGNGEGFVRFKSPIINYKELDI